MHSHVQNLREGLRTDFHHPQGFGVGNVGQTASRTGVPLRAGESNYTEIAAETGLVGGLLWIGWGLALLAALVVAARRGSVFAAALAAAFAAILALAIQTDVIGDPWVAYCVWALAGALVAVRTRAFPEGSRTSGPAAVSSGS